MVKEVVVDVDERGGDVREKWDVGVRN